MDESPPRQQPIPFERGAPHVPGAGADLDPPRRPGVPKLYAPKPLPNTRFPPARQHSDVTVFMQRGPYRTFPPVFGTAVPPKGLSGLIRKAAYHYPDHWLRHWTLLLFADRVDVWEHWLGRNGPVVLPALLVLGVAAGLRAWRRA